MALLLGLSLTAARPAQSATQLFPTAGVSAPTHAALPDTLAGRLRGQVIDRLTQEPVAFAVVWLQRLSFGGLCDEQGFFSLDVTEAHLRETCTDTLVVQLAAFRARYVPVDLQLLPAIDSVLRVVLPRDSTVHISSPLLVQPGRRGHQPEAAAPAGPQRPSFWRRLFSWD